VKAEKNAAELNAVMDNYKRILSGNIDYRIEEESPSKFLFSYCRKI